MKGRIYAPDLQYRYVFEVDVQRQKTNLEKTSLLSKEIFSDMI